MKITAINTMNLLVLHEKEVGTQSQELVTKEKSPKVILGTASN